MQYTMLEHVTKGISNAYDAPSRQIAIVGVKIQISRGELSEISLETIGQAPQSVIPIS
jgi:hypothetical protein